MYEKRPNQVHTVHGKSSSQQRHGLDLRGAVHDVCGADRRDLQGATFVALADES